MTDGDVASLTITGARLVDGSGGAVCEDVAIELAGGRVVAIGSGADPVGEGTQVDARGLTVLPGLIDAHAHMGLVGLYGTAEPLAVLAARMFVNCSTALDEGFTTLRDLGGADGGLVAALESGLVRGPRVLPSGPIICQTGGHGDFAPPFGGPPPWPPGLISPSIAVNDVAQARAAARTALKRGATQLKVILNGGFTGGHPLEHTFLTVEEVRAAVYEAAAQDTYVTAHVHTDRALAMAIEAGVRSIEHGTFLDDERMAEVAAAGVFFVPTLLQLAVAIDHPDEFDLTPASSARLQEALDASAEAVRAARRQGVRLALGSDLVGPDQHGRGGELTMRAQIEDPMAAIVSATAGNAALIGREDSLGRVAPGMIADLIAVAGDPLADPTLFNDAANVVLVVQGGRIVKDTRARVDQGKRMTHKGRLTKEIAITQTAIVDVSEHVLGDVSPFIFGYDVEHVGRAINGGLWDVAARRLRPEVLAPVKALAPAMIRWPGSIHCSRYDWRDGVGEQRKAYPRTAYGDMAESVFAAGGWTPPGMTDEEFVTAVGGPDPNTFGTDELLALCVELGAEPLLAANPNLPPEVAAEWVRYCNKRDDSPRRVNWWTVAYEPWAPYEDGEFASGTEFGELFLTFVAAMREVDPDIRFVVGGVPWPDFVGGLPEGSDLAVVGNKMDTWNSDLVRVVGPEIEAISMHYTFPGALGRLIHDTPSDLQQVATGGDALGPMLDQTLAEVRSTPGGEGLGLQLLEWGWQVHSDELLGTNHRLGDALLLAGCWNRMIERPGGVRLATMNNLVSALSGIQTRGDEVFTTALYLVERLYRETTRTNARAVEVQSPMLHVSKIKDVDNALHVMEAAATDREAPVLDAAATSDERGMTVFIANRSLVESLTVTVTGLPSDGVATLRRLAGPSPYARNDVGQELLELVSEEVLVSDGRLEVTLPPAIVAAVLVEHR